MAMDPFDAPGPSAASRERLDRLRERPASGSPSPPQRAVVPWLISAVLLAFALGLIANPWFEQRVRSMLPGFARPAGPTVEAVAAQARSLAALQARVAAIEQRPAANAAAVQPAAGGLERTARLEARVDTAEREAPAVNARLETLTGDVATLRGRVDATAGVMQATLTDAASASELAQTLVLLGAVRRTIEAGGRLGVEEAALRALLGARQPQAVAAVAALGAAPVTPASLRQSFDVLRSNTVQRGPQSWWDNVAAAAGTMLHGTAVGEDAVLFERASGLLRAGNVAAARAAVAALPAARRPRWAGWIVAADRYLAGMRGLAGLDAAALSPRVGATR